MRYAQWRIEEEPAGSREVDEFLNVLIPRLVPEAEAGKAVTGDTLVFPTAEIVDKNPERIRLRITSADRMWDEGRRLGQASEPRRKADRVHR